MTSPPPASSACGASVNLELLIKLLKLTTSPHDGEALAALRAANLQLAKVGGDWETLLRGKVTIIADPWSGQAATAPKRPPSNGWRPPQQPRPAPPPPPPTPRPRQRTNWRAVPPASASDL